MIRSNTLKAAILGAGICGLASVASAQEAMTDDEKLEFWEQIADCYTVPEGVTDTTVTAGFALDERGRVVDGDVAMLNEVDTITADMSRLFEAARIAVLSCGRRGFDLPEEKFVYWQNVQMTFRSPSTSEAMDANQ